MAIKQPKFVNAPGGVIYDRRIPPAVRDTYMQLRGLAWGKDSTPPLDMDELIAITGKSQSTIYEHMRLLRDLETLRWRTAHNSTLIVSFNRVPAQPVSENSEALNKSLYTSSDPLKVTDLRNKRLIKANSENSELTPSGKAMLAAYIGLLGYDPENATPDDLRALDWLGENYTVEQVRQVYLAVKAEPFWHKRQITPRRLRIEAAEHLRPEADPAEARARSRQAALAQRMSRQ